MKRLCVVLGMLVVASLLPKAASAGPITVIDPIIGVRGGMFGSEPVDSGTMISFAGCPGEMDSYTQCTIFNIGESAFSGGVGSITMHLASGSNPDAELVFDPDTPGPGLNQFFDIETLGGNNFRFSGSGSLMCPSFEGPDHVCGSLTTDDIAFGVRPTYDETSDFIFGLNLTAQVLAVNDQPLNPVPEPTSLLLMGMGIATLAGRRLRRKTS